MKIELIDTYLIDPDLFLKDVNNCSLEELFEEIDKYQYQSRFTKYLDKIESYITQKINLLSSNEIRMMLPGSLSCKRKIDILLKNIYLKDDINLSEFISVRQYQKKYLPIPVSNFGFETEFIKKLENPELYMFQDLERASLDNFQLLENGERGDIPLDMDLHLILLKAKIKRPEFKNNSLVCYIQQKKAGYALGMELVDPFITKNDYKLIERIN